MQNSFKIKMCGTLYLPHDDIISNVIAPLFLCNPAQRTIFRTRQDLRFSLSQLDQDLWMLIIYLPIIVMS